MDAALVIRNADVVTEDGIRRADVLVESGMIVAVGPDLTVGSAGRTVDATGHLLCPGFIDLHAHSALRPFDDPLLSAKVGQGFTTELICPDGLGPAPLSDATVDTRRRYLQGLEPSTNARWDWRSMESYLDALQSAAASANMTSCVPHSAVRESVMGNADRAPDRREMSAMKDLVADSLAAGGRAVSFGMIYAPGLYADTDELRQIAEIAAAYDVPLVPHVRNEAAGVIDSISEFVRVCEETGAHLHVSHVKLVGVPHLLSDLLHTLSEAQDRIRLTCDQYPYGAGSTLLSALLPGYAFDGGPRATLERVSDRSERERMARDMHAGLPHWENLFAACGPENIVITQAAGARRDTVSKTVAAIADETNTDPAIAVIDLLRDTELDACMIDHYSTEKVVREIFTSSGALVGSDGVFNPHPHPRLYGTAPRVLGRYALREQLITVPEAIRRLSTGPAEILGLTDRGVIAPDKRADLVLIDPARYLDTATYDEPHSFPPGVELVTVGGVPVWENGAHTGQRPGVVDGVPQAASTGDVR
ncbi:N-acyl-D-amino-acid deacylase family protein [Rhodococcus sp. T7]|uniref:N-acyl-D-amino-acid deacylase family protein n=1 Tax=Rhodococcus sp. T7 TaxID=627444 RepID=UPI001357318E|nr:amidohydrolase family protein [Rhodococcus sp. T7]KAF0964475.1 D-aminoacylase [Rhodococcus sp. T7]